MQDIQNINVDNNLSECYNMIKKNPISIICVHIECQNKTKQKKKCISI